MLQKLLKVSMVLVLAAFFIGCASGNQPSVKKGPSVDKIQGLEKSKFLTASEINGLLIGKKITFIKHNGKTFDLTHNADGSLDGLPIDAKWDVNKNGTKHIYVRGKTKSSVKIKKIGKIYYCIEGKSVRSTFQL